jgi:hypothetical protein
MNIRRLGLAVIASLAISCGGGGKDGAVKSAVAPGGTRDQSRWPSDDRSMCDWRSKPDLEVSETMGPGATRPNIRRVYKSVGEGENRHKILICREIDTNLDGIKDVVRTFNPKGEPIHEEADRNYDGKIDVWLNFVDGKLAEEDTDTNGDGRPDVWKYYVNGQLQRIRRDRNGDGKPDVWEMYSKGRLDRIGVDETFDGHVDRWDRDEQLKYEADTAERNARAAMEGDGGSSTARPAADAGAPSAKAIAPSVKADAGAPKGKPASKK